MKKLIIIAITLFAGVTANSQVTLEKTFSTTSTDAITYTLSPIYENLYSSGTIAYMLYDSRNPNAINVYNLDNSLYANKSITPPAGYQVYTFLEASKHLYNDNDKIEFTIIFKKTDEFKFITQIQDEDGSVLIDFGGYVSMNWFVTNNKFVMYVNYAESINKDDIFKNEIYSLGGTVPASTTTLKSASTTKSAYPNPSSSIINIPYNITGTSILTIYNMNGQIVDTKTIDNYFNELQLNVSNYTPGIYTYQYNGIINRFIVK